MARANQASSSRTTAARNQPAAAAGRSAKGPAKKDNKTGVDTDVTAALAAIDGEWGGAEAREGFGEVENGNYQVKIEEAVVNHAKSSGRLQVTWTLMIVNGPYAGRKLWKHDGIDNADSIGWFKGGIARIGLDAPASVKEVPALLQSVVGSYAEVNVKLKDGQDKPNVYFNKALDDSDVEDETTGEGGAEGTTEPEPEPAKGGATSGGGRRTRAAAPAAEPEPEPEPEEEPEEEPETEEEAGLGQVTISFDEKTISATLAPKIDALAKKAGCNPEDYGNKADLLADTAEQFGVSGEYNSAVKLFNDTLAASKK